MSRTKIICFLCCSIIMMNIAITACQATTSVPPICENTILDEMPQRIRKVCAALENSNQFAEALNAYIRKEAAGVRQGRAECAPVSGRRFTSAQQ
ncbi:dromyosuppressin [Topomyia yanbarensis]|uniref:dromyosuppressin n=1 Tax=Topomyia yanbarensis TaxID=2498891 RepID=UPI00273BC385|nr:dromyosuppressin [Topomyia yanbarensis]